MTQYLAPPTIERFNDDRHGHLIEPLTELLHWAYSPLLRDGMKYLASHQPPETTRERLLEGESYLLFFNRQLAGTATLYHEQPESSCEYYRQNGVYSFGQFAIRPDLQGLGFGKLLMAHLEARARECGARELALDTSENAKNLIQMYQRWGYEIAATTQWGVTNYLSLVMTKHLHLNRPVESAFVLRNQNLAY